MREIRTPTTAATHKDLVERVARAIALAEMRNIDPADCEAWLNRVWEQKVPSAQAAIAACHAAEPGRRRDAAGPSAGSVLRTRCAAATVPDAGACRAGEMRASVIEKVAARYHGQMEKFYTQMGQDNTAEGFPGFADKHYQRAKAHRVYAAEIRGQVWLKATTARVTP